MPRTETCFNCEGSGNVELLTGEAPCSECSGNGFVQVEESDEDRGARFHAEYHQKMGLNNDEVAPLIEPEATIAFEDTFDLTDDTPTPGRMANQTWRILEEQRMAAEETIREAEAEIERWTNKMVDAFKTKGMCEAGQRALDGGL